MARDVVSRLTTFAVCGAVARGSLAAADATPAISRLTPTVVHPGEVIAVKIDGSGFSAAASVSVAGAGLVVRDQFVASASLLMALVEIPDAAPQGYVTLAVTDGGTAVSKPLYVYGDGPLPGGQPALTGTSRGVVRPYRGVSPIYGNTSVMLDGRDLPPFGPIPFGGEVVIDEDAPSGVSLDGAPAGGSEQVGFRVLSSASDAGPHDVVVRNVPTGLSDVLPGAFVVRPWGNEYIPLAPHRVLDTRFMPLPNHPYSLPLEPGETVRIPDVANSPGDAVVLNVTVTDPSAAGYLTVYPSGEAVPLASSLNFTVGETVANLVTVAAGPDQGIAIFNFGGTAHVIADLVGTYTPSDNNPAHYTQGGAFIPLTPERLLDTRSDTGGIPLGPGETRRLQIANPGDHVTAVAISLTATEPTAPGYLSTLPAGQVPYPGAQPTVSNVNFLPGQTVPNMAIVKLGEGPGNWGAINIFNYTGTTHVIVDILGEFDDGTMPIDGGLFHAITPTRFIDTRDSSPLGPNSSLTLPTAGRSGLPPPDDDHPTTAVVMNVTATQPTAPGYLTVWPGGDQPTASNLNMIPGQTVPNMVSVPVGNDGAIHIYNFAGTTHVIADVTGYYS
jgi:hypothetical protein